MTTKTTKRAASSKPTTKKKGKRDDAQVSLPIVLIDEDPAISLRRTLRRSMPGALVAGLDEAGRGPLAGPVVAAACVLPDKLPDDLLALNDSKQLSEEQRDALFPLITKHAVAFGVAIVEASRIDEINILRASLEAMQIAFALCGQMITHAPLAGAVVDGNMMAPLPLTIRQKTVIGGDARSRPIMAASILAKVTRDRRMRDEHARYPAYGFDVHKGYGTPQHMKALKDVGPCPLHRKSFAPVRAAYGLDDDGAAALLAQEEAAVIVATQQAEANAEAVDAVAATMAGRA